MNPHRSQRTMENESLSIVRRAEPPHKWHPGKEVPAVASFVGSIFNRKYPPERMWTIRRTLLDRGGDS
jgi:hypothetical protein